MDHYIKLAKFATFFLGVLLIINEVISLYKNSITAIAAIPYISFIAVILVTILILDKKSKLISTYKLEGGELDYEEDHDI